MSALIRPIGDDGFLVRVDKVSSMRMLWADFRATDHELTLICSGHDTSLAEIDDLRFMAQVAWSRFNY